MQGPGIAPARLLACLSDWENFAPNEAIRISVGEVGTAGVEGYRLEIDASGARVVGASDAGVFYGLQSLAHMVRSALEEGSDLPALQVLDWPDIPYRAVHFDTKHHLDTIDAYYDAIDRLAALKVNAIIWEFEDKLRYRRRPVIGAANAISIEQMQALTQYARRRHIEISPLVQGLGHASFILKHPEYAHLRDDASNDWAFDPIVEETYELQFDLYLDAIKATPGAKYLHIGGDEVNVGKSEAALHSGLSPLELHLHWLDRVSAFLAKHDRVPIMWDDMPLRHGGVYGSTYDTESSRTEVSQQWNSARTKLDELVERFPRDAVYMRWSYSSPGTHGNHAALDWYAAGGVEAMAATAAQTRWPVFPRNDGNVESIRTFCQMTAERELRGILCTAWDDDSPHMAFYWRGWTCFSDFAWSAQGRTGSEALSAFAEQAYGAEAGPHAAEGLRQLGQAMDAWDTMLTSASRRNVCQSNTMDGILDAPVGLGIRAWRLEHRDRIGRAAEALRTSISARDSFLAALQTCGRNRFDLRLALALTELQSWSHEVMADISVVPEAGLDDRWNAFLAVYEEKRILRNPPGYVLDQNHHAHQANSSNGPEWMIAVESVFHERLKSWRETIR
jgi:hexosaminidase